MKRRLLYALEALAILLVVPLGAVWPSVYTLIAIAVIPAFVMATIRAVRPGLFAPRELQDPKRSLRRYIHLSAVASVGSVLFQAGWLTINHSAAADIIVAKGAPRVVRIVFDVEGGESMEKLAGRRVFRIPQSGVLLSRVRRDGGWWRNGERRFFLAAEEAPRPIAGDVGGSGVTTVGSCAANYDYYILARIPELPSEGQFPFGDAAELGVDCQGGRLIRR